VISALADSDDHLTAEDLIAEVERRLPGVSPSTVYRLIQRLSDLDILEHVHTSVGPPIYHLHEHSHAHLVCNGCGGIFDIDDQLLNDLTRTLERELEFTLEPHHSALVGYCKTCAANRRRHVH
jgi:Fur family transcriptional regulator, ferric uptake regulator